MYVGGPNSRKDYHLELGEEIFYQEKGDMCLPIMERGIPKDVIIKEGEIFIIPARVPHSPQRFKDTVGLVIERERDLTEIDGCRWYTNDLSQPLYEEWFYCQDLVINLPPIAQRYKNSEQFRTDIPQEFGPTPWKIDVESKVMDPFPLANWIDSHKLNIPHEGSPLPNVHEFQVILFGEGTRDFHLKTEVLYWQWEGDSDIQLENTTDLINLNKKCFYLVAPNKAHTVKVLGSSLVLQIYNNHTKYETMKCVLY